VNEKLAVSKSSLVPWLAYDGNTGVLDLIERVGQIRWEDKNTFDFWRKGAEFELCITQLYHIGVDSAHTPFMNLWLTR
jgi:hypothetical protein